MATESSNFIKAWVIALLKLNNVLTPEEYSESVRKLGLYVHSVNQAKRRSAKRKR